MANGAAEKDGHLRAGDELIGIDGVMVKGRSHKQVLDLMTNAARNGQVMLTVRRKVIYRGEKQLQEHPTLFRCFSAYSRSSDLLVPSVRYFILIQ